MSKIIVLDDDAQFRGMLQRILEKVGYEVQCVESAKSLMSELRVSEVDLIVTDIIMPEQDGIQTITEVKKEFPEAKIIAISGGGRFGPASYLDTAQMLGACRSFEKPLNMPEFLEAVETELTAVS
ncbi:MAG: DNA-binding NtrC family response regulator [Planctomycetota bacterium]|jgi:DNA-binding NtrC family response regulator